MKTLLVQESDWLVKGPHQQHHLMEKLALRGHLVRVIDYEIQWRQTKNGFYSRRQFYASINKIYDGAKVDVVRPGILKLPVCDYLSLVITHQKELAFQFKDFRPDVIVGFGILNTYLAAAAAKRSGLPFVYYLIDALHTLIPAKVFHSLGRTIESSALRMADKVVVINRKLQDYTVKMGAPREKTHVIAAGVDFTRFRLNIGGDEIRGRYGIQQKDTVLFFMGWLYKFSGLKDVLLALAKTDSPGLKCLIAGEGDAYEELAEISRQHNLQDRVIFTGQRPYEEIPELIAAADICLLPAEPTEKIMQDIVPIKLYEYMAMAKPVISTNLPGVRKEFGEDNGVVYVERPEDVVPKAIELVENGRLAELGQKARRFVERNSWDKVTDEFEALLKEAIYEKRSTQP
ncbi:MAG: glycosyltransferase family 4 protein [Firmicutes bacterium]|nr:glycosyltransferase family 4 protein [Bacillota bacterium]